MQSLWNVEERLLLFLLRESVDTFSYKERYELKYAIFLLV